MSFLGFQMRLSFPSYRPVSCIRPVRSCIRPIKN